MNSPFIEALKELDSKLDVHVAQWQLISDTLIGPQPKSVCCHSEATTYQMKDVCSCCLERCELER